MRILVLLTLVLTSIFAYAQKKSVYQGPADELITVRTISLLPVFDNIRGIYARPIESHLVENLKNSHQWQYTESNMAGPVLTPDELESDSTAVENLANGITSDAFIAMGIVKGPSGISMKLNLFLKADKKILLQDTVTGISRNHIDSLKDTALEMLKRTLRKLPYSGIVMSRDGTRVTVNLGKKDGVENNQVISVIQIIKLNRHPKFNFLINSEKEIIGKIKLIKIDETLSFGRIITEKEAGTIQSNSKIGPLSDIVYANTDSLSENSEGEQSLTQRPESQISFGSNPESWVPRRQPTFGRIGAKMGVGRFQENSSGTQSLDASAPLYPNVALEGELWLNPVWSMHATMRQGIISTRNPVSGGSPSDLSHSLSAYEFVLGYNFRVANSLRSPKFEVLGGFSNYRLFVDQSTPVGLTTKSYSGPKFGVTGSYPMPGSSPYTVGAALNFMFDPKLKETPSTSGSGDHSVSSFGGFVDKQLSINLAARFALDFELYSSDFSGGGSSSQKHTLASAGLYYLF